MIRKRIGLKLPVKADLRVAKTVEKIVTFVDPITGKKTAIKCKRIQIVNAAKYQYRQVKKLLKGMQ